VKLIDIITARLDVDRSFFGHFAELALKDVRINEQDGPRQ